MICVNLPKRRVDERTGQHCGRVPSKRCLHWRILKGAKPADLPVVQSSNFPAGHQRPHRPNARHRGAARGARARRRGDRIGADFLRNCCAIRPSARSMCGDRQLQPSRALALAQPPSAPEDVIAPSPHPAPRRIKAHTHPGFRAIEKADIIRVRSGSHLGNPGRDGLRAIPLKSARQKVPSLPRM